MGELLEERRHDTTARLKALETKLDDAKAVLVDKACVYVTGSGGRGEMRQDSDLDVFIVSDVEVRKEKRRSGEGAKPKLTRLDGIVVKAALIKANQALGFEPFSKDGKYLETYTIEDLCENLGRPEDDHTNTFTARLLLLLESQPLLGHELYRTAVNDVIAPYWRDFPRHEDSFRPVFLLNDIVRLWKTFCVNYEAFTEQQPDDKRAKRKLQNYKLKNSRVLTCYSAIFYLMQVFAEQRTVRPPDASEMVRLSPTERLEWIAARPSFAHGATVAHLLEHYEQFLRSTAPPERVMIDVFKDPARRKDLDGAADNVGKTVFELLAQMGAGNELYRYIIV